MNEDVLSESYLPSSITFVFLVTQKKRRKVTCYLCKYFTSRYNVYKKNIVYGDVFLLFSYRRQIRDLFARARARFGIVHTILLINFPNYFIEVN